MKKTKWFAALAACVLVLLAAGCDNGSDGPDSVPVAKVTLNETELTLPVDGTVTLKATVEPDDADDKTVAWSSSNEAVAKVGNDGTVTAVADGTATITAKAGGKSATCEVTVTSVVVTAVELEPKTLSLTVGETKELKVRVLPAEASVVTVLWSSSNDAVATVGSDGTVTAAKAGSATITAKAGDKAATCEVTVNVHTHHYVDWKCEICGLDKPSLGDDGEIDDNGKLTEYTGNATTLEIPVGVSSIGSSAFKGRTSLTEVTIPDGVTKIGDSAFEGCTNLAKVTIPDSVTAIENAAFYRCTSLKEIQFNGTKEQWNAIAGSGNVNIPCIICTDGFIGVKDVPGYLTMSGTKVTGYTGTVPKDLAIPDGVTEIGRGAFYNCADIESVTIPGSVTEIEDRGSSSSYHGAFQKCANLKTVTMCDGVKTIGSYAFYECTNLANVTIPGSVTSIGSDAFYNCTSLASVTIPGSVTKIGNDAFYGCTALETVTIPGSVTSFGIDAFRDCTNLKTVTISDGVTEIGISAFYRCTSLAKVTIPASVTKIGVTAFYGCTSLAEIEFKGTKAQWNAIEGSADVNATVIRCSDGNIGVDKVPEYLTMSGMAVTGYTGTVPADLTIPDGVTAINASAFKDCASLTKVTIPASVTSIGSNAFSGCTNLTEMEFKGTIAQWKALKGSYNSPATYICCSDGNIGVKDVPEYLTMYGTTVTKHTDPHPANLVIPDGVESISYDAFKGCTNLESVTIPESVTEIGSSSFENCTNLKSVSIPNSVTGIGRSAFKGCTNLTNVTIGYGVTKIELYAFWSGKKLTEIQFNGTKEQWNEIEIAGGGTLSNTAIYNPVYITIHCKDGDIIEE